MPTRLTSLTFPAPLPDSWAQITPYCSPGGASRGTATVASSVALLCGARVRAPRLTETQVVISFWVCPPANWKLPCEIVAAAG